MDGYQIIVSVALVYLLWTLQTLAKQVHTITKVLDEWRYEWGQRTPHQISHAEIMSDVYREEKE